MHTILRNYPASIEIQSLKDGLFRVLLVFTACQHSLMYGVAPYWVNRTGRPQAELRDSRRLASKAGGWLAGEIWLKSAGLIGRL